jgi:hypothetical protein
VDIMDFRHLRLAPLGLLAVSLGWTATAIADAPAPRDQSTQGGGVVISEFSQNSKSLAVDAVSQRAPTRDGQVDGIFDVTVAGDVTAFVLLSVDANGRPTGSQWDTIHVPAAIGGPGNNPSWILGVEEHGQLRNLTDGRIPLLTGSHRFKLYGSNNGAFKTGVSFRLFAVAANGDVVSSPILAYKTE